MGANVTENHAHHDPATSCDEITLSQEGSNARVTLRGEIDIDVRPSFKRILQELRAVRGTVDIDASEVDFIDSSGIAVLGEIAHEHPSRVTITNAPPTMLFILEVTGLINMVRVHNPEGV